MTKFISRLRFLPATIFAASLMLTVKIGAIYQGLDGLLTGVITVAGAEAQQPAVQPPAGTPPPKALTPNAPPPGLAPTTPPGLTPTTPPANTAATTPPPGLTPVTPPAETKAAEGAPADQAGAAAPGATQKPIEDPTLLTQSEIDLLQQLAERREVIEARERELNLREGMLKAAETRIDKKVADLKTLEATVKNLLAKYNDQQAAKIASLVKIYENMKPKDAARIFEGLDMDTLLMVAERMKERSLAPIMANMDPKKARDVTFDLARRRQLPQPGQAGG